MVPEFEDRLGTPLYVTAEPVRYEYSVSRVADSNGTSASVFWVPYWFFFFKSSAPPRDLHFSPPRRSSDRGGRPLKRLVVARHKLTTESTKISNRVRSMLHWAAPGVLKAAGGTVSAGLVAVLGRWSDLR